jgi:1-acyl-sn-glycerol-3-phosphate acyltransferase
VSKSTTQVSLLSALDPAAQQVWLTFKNVCHFVFLCAWSALWISIALVTLCVTFDREIPISFARRFWAPGLLWFAGAKMEVHGHESLDPTKSYVFVSNHESLLDTVIAFYAVPLNIRFVAKKEVAYIPFVGWYAWAMGFIFVDRRNHARAMASMRRAGEIVRQGASVMFFAEGTRSRTGVVQPFKKGAFHLAVEAGVDVVPFAISGARDVLPCDGFRVRPGTIHVRFGAPIESVGVPADDVVPLLEKTRDAVIALHQSVGGVGGPASHAATLCAVPRAISDDVSETRRAA